MVKFFLDTNILVYSLHQDSPKYKEVNDFLKRCFSKNITCYFLSSSLKDTYYVLHRHYLSESEARQCIRLLRNILSMVDLSSAIVDEAFLSDEPDFEDALIRCAAERLQVNAIISYDERAFAQSFLPKLSAEEALS